MQIPSPPFTERHPVVDTIHGVEITDPYRWLEDGDSPRTRAWVVDQTRYARAFLDRLPGRDRIAARLLETLDCGALGGITPRGRWRFSARRRPGMNQLALFVSDGDDGEPRLLVDPAPRARDAASALDWFQPSRDGSLVAVGISEGGDENSVLQFVETASGRLLEDRISRCRLAAVAWEPDGKAVLYTRLPAPGSVPPGEEHYHRHVWRHVVGSPVGDDVRIFGDGQPKLDFPSLLSVSESGRWTVVSVSRGWDRTAVHLADTSAAGEFRPFFKPEGGGILYAWFAGERLLGMTDLDAPNRRVVEIDPADPEPDRWRTLVAEGDHVIEAFEATASHLLVHRLVDATSRLTIHGPDGRLEREVALPHSCTVTAIRTSPALAHAYVTVEEFTRPARALRVDPGDGSTTEVAALPLPPGFDPGRHPVRQAFFTSRDGTQVPIFLVGRAAGAGPVVLTGYGGFNLARTPAWSPTVVPFLEAGGLYAVANLRGGSEYGEDWHQAGMRARKQNVFDDFIAAGQWLVEQGTCSPDQLGILGGSNGGLLVGAAMTQRPDLFGAVVCRVPLLDMVRYEGFQVAQLWASEYGSAAVPEEFGWLHAYSPYHHVQDGVRYPPTLLTTGEQDTRVDPMHARKMAALLQAAQPDGVTVLRVEPRAGHGQGKPVAKLVPEETDVWAFLMAALGGR